MPFESSGRFRANRNYFLLRVAEFENFQDPDMFSPHMDLMFVRRVYAEFQQKLPDISFDTSGFESTSCVLATRPERAARDLAKMFLVSANSKFEIEVLNTTPDTFTLRYKRSRRQLNEAVWSHPVTVARNMVLLAQPYAPNVSRYSTVELPFLARETVFVQFFRLEPSFQFYEYAAVIQPIDNRRLRLPGWNHETEDYVPFDKKILVKSLFRPFRVVQGPNDFVCSANSARDAFVKSRSKLQNSHVPVKITDTFTKHRFVNQAGDVRFLLNDRPRVNQFKRRADNKRRRTHCVEKTYLFEREPFQHVLHSSYRTGALFFRELCKNLENSIAKFRAIERSERMNDRTKESATFVLLRNRWFLIACAIATDGADGILEIAFDFLNRRNPAQSRLDYTHFPPNLYTTLRDALTGVEGDLGDVGEFVQEADVDTLAARNIPLPPSLGCGNAANQTRGNQMQVVEGHNPFPDDLLSGEDARTFEEWDTAGHTRAHVLDTYTKSIRDDIPRIQKRNTPFGNYLQAISIEPVVLQQPQQAVHFGVTKQPVTPFRVIVRALRRFLGI